VKKWKFSGSTRSELGHRTWDRLASLKKTCSRWGVNFWTDLQDRMRGGGPIPRLAELIGHQAEETSARRAAAAPLA